MGSVNASARGAEFAIRPAIVVRANRAVGGVGALESQFADLGEPFGGVVASSAHDGLTLTYSVEIRLGEALVMLLGRRDECETLDRILNAARAGHGGSIVALGEPGIGKSTLVDYAIDSASGVRVLRSVWSETEKELPHAALQQLCSSDLADLAPRFEMSQSDARGVVDTVQAGPVPRLDIDEAWEAVRAEVGDVRVRIVKPKRAAGSLPVV